jgi:hypothetical protein
MTRGGESAPADTEGSSSLIADEGFVDDCHAKPRVIRQLKEMEPDEGQE